MSGLSHFVGTDTLEWTSLRAAGSGVPLLVLAGKIACLGGIVIEVNKTLAVFSEGQVENPFVQTERYAYNAWVRGHRPFLRYDNTHRYRGHADDHHRHDMDWRTGRGTVSHVGEAAWPSLAVMISEVEAWHADNHGALPHPAWELTSLEGLRAGAGG